MQNKIGRAGPIALTTTLATNLLNAAITSLAGSVTLVHTQPVLILRRIRVVNKTASAATVSLWLGASGVNTAGTEFAFLGRSIPANGYEDWVGMCRMESTDFLVGGSGTATALSIEFEYELGF